MSDTATLFCWGLAIGVVVMLLVVGLIDPRGDGQRRGFREGIAHCLSRPIPAECVATDTTMTITPRK